MFLAVEDPYVIGGGAVVLLGLLIRQFVSDRTWVVLVKELREELKTARTEREEERVACAKERGEWKAEKTDYDVKIKSLEGEVYILRRQMQGDRWLGIDPGSRPKIIRPKEGGE